MKLLLSQREICLTNSMGTDMMCDALEQDWHRFLNGHELIVHPNLGKVVPNLDYDCLILTGGPDSLSRHQTEDALFAHALEQHKPIVGFCHGAFVINDLTGGTNGRICGHEAGFHHISMNGVKHTVNSHHSQCLSHLGDSMIAVAWDQDGNIEAFQHISKPIHGVVWHPERMSDPVLPTAVKNLLFA